MNSSFGGQGFGGQGYGGQGFGGFGAGGGDGRGMFGGAGMSDLFESLGQLKQNFEESIGQRFDQKGSSRMGRGDVRVAILALLAEQPMHGYQIIQELAARTDGHWKPSPGAIYPALNQLEDEGLIRPLDGGKVFEVTDAGRAEAEAAAAQPAPWEHAGGEQDPARALAHSMRQAAQAVGAIAQSGDADLISKATAQLDELKRKLYQLLAES